MDDQHTLRHYNIAFDAKRAYQNGTGLGHYSRTLIGSLVSMYPQHQYYLATPKLATRFTLPVGPNVHTITPATFLQKRLPSLWRSSLITSQLTHIPIDLYHGLSHEIPRGLHHTRIKSVVTIHDLIFERYPKQYNWLDVQIYRYKFKYACTNADHIIAISQQTKNDIIRFYGIPSDKISVCYQSCNPQFQPSVSIAEKNSIKSMYSLPEQFFLYVGSIIERKNLLNICKAYALLQHKLAIPLVVIGEGGSYKKQVQQYIQSAGIQGKIIFLSDTAAAAHSPSFQSAAHFPAIYQMATGMVYPSIFEGFGIPVLEALWSKTPVITSNVSCLPETGGNGALYIDPYTPLAIAEALLQVAHGGSAIKQMVERGWAHAQYFTPEKCAAAVMQVYLRLL
jgi:glycosyltransferase involved in cell wall biosynthesis